MTSTLRKKFGSKNGKGNKESAFISPMKEFQLPALYVREEVTPSGQPFTVESAFGFSCRVKYEDPRHHKILTKHKCNIQVHPQKGIQINRQGKSYLSAGATSTWIPYERIGRFFVFKQEPNELVLCTLGMDSVNRFYLIHFKNPEEVNRLCDVIETAKSLNETLRRGDVLEETMTSNKYPRKSQTSSAKLNENDRQSPAVLAVHSKAEMQEKSEEEEQTALRQYDEMLHDFETDGSSSLHGNGKLKEPGSQLLIHYKPTKDSGIDSDSILTYEPVRHAPTPTPHQEKADTMKSNSSSLQSLQFLRRESQRRDVLHEDIHFINYGNSGLYESNDGPIYFYVAHVKSNFSPHSLEGGKMKQRPLKDARSVSEAVLHHSKVLSNNSIPESFLSKSSTNLAKDKSIKPDYSSKRYKSTLTLPSLISNSSKKMSTTSQQTSGKNSPEFCEMEVKLDLESEGEEYCSNHRSYHSMERLRVASVCIKGDKNFRRNTSKTYSSRL